MRMLETTLLTGPYDWDPALIPRAAFDARVAAVRTVLREHGLAGLLVGGLSPEHGALCYLTGFVPKLGPALAFVPAAGDLRIAFSGGPAMLPSAHRLTYVEKVQAVREAEQDIAAWLAESGGARFGLWDENAIPYALRQAIDRAAPSPVVVLDAALDPLRRRKTALELGLIRRASEILTIAVHELRSSLANGSGVRSAALAAERSAYVHGAQDVRMLTSLRDGGMPQPLGPHDARVDPLLACIAVRFAGHWAEGLVTVASRQSAAQAASQNALAAILRDVRADVTSSALGEAAARSRSPYRSHSFAAANFGNGIGLSREEAPYLAHPNVLQDGDVCTLRVGATADDTDTAIASAMVNVTSDGAEVIWK